MPYKVLSPLNHDNTVYPVGSEIDLEDAMAEALLTIGVVEPIEIPLELAVAQELLMINAVKPIEIPQAEAVPPEAVPPKKKTDKDV